MIIYIILITHLAQKSYFWDILLQWFLSKYCALSCSKIRKKNNLTADPEIWAWKLQLSNFWKMKSCKIYQLTGTQTDKPITRNMGIRSLSPLYVSFVLDSLLYLYKKSQIPLLTAFWVTLKKMKPNKSSKTLLHCMFLYITLQRNVGSVSF